MFWVLNDGNPRRPMSSLGRTQAGTAFQSTSMNAKQLPAARSRSNRGSQAMKEQDSEGTVELVIPK